MFSILVLTTFLIPNTASIESFDNKLEINDIDRESWWWTDAELITTDSTDESHSIKTVIDENDAIHLCWKDDTDLAGSGADVDIFYKKLDLKTNTWSVIEVVSTESSSASQDPSIALDAQGDLHVVWHDTENYDSAGTDADIFYKIRDSAGTWSSAEVVSTSSSLSSFAPEIAVDSSYNAHVVWYDDHNFDGTDLDIIYKVRSAATDTWSSHTVISTDSTSSSYSPQIIVDKTDQVYVTWYDYTAGLYGSSPFADVLYKKWDAVNGWSSGKIISYDSLADDSYSPDFVVDDSNSIHVAWHDSTDLKGAGTDRDIFYRKLDSASSTWSELTVISTESNSISGASEIKVDSDFNVHIGWQENDNIASSGTDSDIFYKYIDGETSGLSDSVLISDISDLDTFNPSITIDSKGFIHVFYNDYSDVLGSGADRDIFYKKHVGPPGTPILHSIVPEVSSQSNISLTWSKEISADMYEVYRSNSFISDISGLSVLDTITETFYFDSLNESGVFYYAIVASNDYGDSGISNIEFVEYQGRLGNLFSNLNWGEIIIIGGILGALQVVTAVVIFLAISANRPSSSSKKGKKK